MRQRSLQQHEEMLTHPHDTLVVEQLVGVVQAGRDVPFLRRPLEDDVARRVATSAVPRRCLRERMCEPDLEQGVLAAPGFCSEQLEQLGDRTCCLLYTSPSP